MAISQVSSASASLPQQKITPSQVLRSEIDKTGKAANGRSKSEEEKAIAATSAAAGVGAGAVQQVFTETQNKAVRNTVAGTGVNGVSGSTKPSAAKTVDQEVKAVAARGGNETSFKVQQARQDRLAAEVQRGKVAEQARNAQAAEDNRVATLQLSSQQQRSSANVLQLQRNKLAAEFEATKKQNVEVKPVERVDPRVVNNQVQAERVQKTQEVAQLEKFKQISTSQIKSNVEKNDVALKEAVKGPAEVQKAQPAAKPPAEAPSPLGQNISIKA